MQHILTCAKQYVGLAEIKGPKSNPTIAGWIKHYARNLGRWAFSRGDEIAWCAVFVSKVLDECGYRATNHGLAVKYASWGKPSRISPGAVIVIKRTKQGVDKRTGSRAGYHVGFLIRISRHYIVILGGNQSDRVKVSYFPRSKYDIVAIRKPSEL